MPALPVSPSAVSIRRVQADGVSIFYREAGNPSAPAILLLHGFPSSSHMFRDLIPRLACHYRVVAPDLPGFGFTDVPEHRAYAYRFADLAHTVDAFTEALGLSRYALYVFDYGAPVGLRLAMAHPERVTALISQNGNAYLQGLSDGWNPIQAYWAHPSAENRDALRGFMSPDGVRFQYLQGVSDPAVVAPESYTLDSALLGRPGNIDTQLDLILDYQSNVALYPQFQAYFRAHQPPLLAVWGRNDPFFLPPGAEAFQGDLPNAVVKFYDTGHFALETHAGPIAADIQAFLAEHALTAFVATAL
jgi:pimeloyl-ACP methyl ester carboxylesterase